MERATGLQSTKRNVSFIGQIYDPLGFLSPVTIAFKILMQEVGKMKVPWDQPLIGEQLTRLEALIESLKESMQLRIPRHYFNGLLIDSSNKIQLVEFCDASNAAYATVVYIIDSSNITTNGLQVLLYLRLKCHLWKLKPYPAWSCYQHSS